MSKKPIANSCNHFVTRSGKVYSKRKGRYVTPFMCNNYLCVHLTDDSGTKLVLQIHRLVAEAFVDNKEGKNEIKHLDGNRLNNRASNLQWADQPVDGGLPHPDHPKYLIFEDGRVYSKVCNRFLKPTKGAAGYRQLWILNAKGERKWKTLSRLVAFLYCKNPHKKRVVDHKDENKLNDHKDNLQFVTQKKNIRLGFIRRRKALKLKDRPAVKRSHKSHPIGKKKRRTK